MSIIKQFPLEKARSGQVAVLNATEKAFSEGYKNILLESPVGSGKSAIAIAVAKFYSRGHVLTPRKSLQNQYMDDFSHEEVITMKGRGSYPCTISSSKPEYNKVIRDITSGKTFTPTGGQQTCASGPCINVKAIKETCETDGKPCPYLIAIDTAQKTDIVVHNLHSFIYQAYFADRFQRRPVLVIDECHEIEGTIRDFAKRKVTLPKVIPSKDLEITSNFKTLDDWAEWFITYIPLFTDNNGSTEKPSDRAVFKASLLSLADLSPKFGEKFVPSIEKDIVYGRTLFSFTPEYVGDLVNTLLLDFGEKRLLMSGTIYNKTLYCRNNGLNPDETCFIRTSSTFPVDSRPIYLKKDYLVDTSHALWEENFQEMIDKISSILEIFHDVKGLIHTPSYRASQEIYDALKKTGRMVIHSKDDLQEKLSSFYADPDPKIFLSPVCQQGVDFKYDRARFQIILRVPYENTSDPFNNYKVRNDFHWYNYQALVTFGQQLGRINRAEDDFGVTILMDERFGKFVSANRNTLPKWLTNSIIYK